MQGVNSRSNNGWTPLHHAIGCGSPYLDIATLLLERGARTEAKDAIGATPLQLAVEQSSADAICRLVEANADILTRDNEGRNVIHRAASIGDVMTAKLLFELGGKILINAPDNANRCPALYADRHDKFDFLEWIEKEHGAIKEFRSGDLDRKETAHADTRNKRKTDKRKK